YPHGADLVAVGLAIPPAPGLVGDVALLVPIRSAGRGELAPSRTRSRRKYGGRRTCTRDRRPRTLSLRPASRAPNKQRDRLRQRIRPVPAALADTRRSA